jgi:hypothetical protein
MDSNFQFRTEIGSGFEVSAEWWPIDRRRGGIIRAVVGLGKPIEQLRCLEESSFTAALKAPTLLAVERGIAELTVRIHSAPAASHERTERSRDGVLLSPSCQPPPCLRGIGRRLIGGTRVEHPLMRERRPRLDPLRRAGYAR